MLGGLTGEPGACLTGGEVPALLRLHFPWGNQEQVINDVTQYCVL